MTTQNYENILPQYNTLNLSARENLETNDKEKMVENVNASLDLNDEQQAQNDAQRQLFVAALGHKSKMTQAEIYLSVALEKDVSLNTTNEIMLESLKKTQDENKAIQAYAAYQEAQNPVQPRF